ncbi:myosin-6-like [Pituophis catenifer annectens]|uniref:myosin-6-like n=1 Tax=Pituophis catenifer annectens TaxID=94852 RepID=UPI0039960704
MSSPAQQKSTEVLTKADKSAMLPTIQAIQVTLSTIQETMLLLQEKMTNNHVELKSDIHSIDQKMSEIQESIHNNEKKIKKVETRVEQNERNLDSINQKLMAQNRELEDSIIQLEMDRAAFYLRFQNVVEEKDEDLGAVMVDLIAGILQQDKDDIIKKLDEIYRVKTNYARRNKLPREVHVRFALRKVKDVVYNIVRDEPVNFKGKEVIVLKQVPKRVRDLRRDYRFLEIQLNKRSIPFRWLIPEGMLITWQGKRIKIDSLVSAQELLDQLRGEGEGQSSKEELDIASQEEINVQLKKSKEGILEDKELEEKEAKETTGKKQRPQRAVNINKNYVVS